MDVPALLGTLITLVVGALLGFVPTYLLERRRERQQTRTRWDEALYAAANELVAAARRSQHLADQVSRGQQDEGQSRRLDDEQQRIRVATEHLRIVGNREVQLAAREVLRHSWAYRLEAEGRPDPYAAEYEGVEVIDRIRAAHLAFYQAVRRQLRVPMPDDLPPDLRGAPGEATPGPTQ